MIVTPFNVNEFDKVFAFAFKVTIDLIPCRFFFNVCGIFMRVVLITLFFGFFCFRDYGIKSNLKVVMFGCF